MWLVRFEYVNAGCHPEHYDGAHPAIQTDQVPEGHWIPVVVRHLQHPDAVEQFRGLNELVKQGELIRNARISKVIDVEFEV
jgi:hypothetical protein